MAQTPQKENIMRTLNDGLLRATVKVRMPDGTHEIVTVKIDTHSNISLVSPRVGTVRNKHPWESATAQATGIGGIALLGKTATITLYKVDQICKLDAYYGPNQIFADGTVALIGLPHIRMLGIDLNAQADAPSLTSMKFREGPMMKEYRKIAIAKANSLYSTHKNKLRNLSSMNKGNGGIVGLPTVLSCIATENPTIKDDNYVCYLADKIVGQYLDVVKDPFESKPLDINSIQTANMTANQRKSFESIIRSHEHVFAKSTNTLPKPMRDVKPHQFLLKPDAKFIKVGRPKYGKHTTKYLIKWKNWGLKGGLISPCPLAENVSRLHIAGKYKSEKIKIPDDLRVCWAGIELNEQLRKTIATYPNPQKAVYRAAKHKYKFVGDGLKQYWSLLLTEEASKMTAFWLPDETGHYRLYKFNRLVMGTKNAATVAQNAYNAAMYKYLTVEQRNCIANFADDFIGGADTIEELLSLFEAFLDMCANAGITLNPKKVRVGFTTETFYGYDLTGDTIEPSDKNLSPIRTMTRPTDQSQLRSVMGVFNQYQPFIKNFGRAGQPAAILRALLKKGVKFKTEWKEEHDQAFETLREQCLSPDLKLHSPNDNLPLILETDGSDDGWGGVLFQMVDGERRTIRMWSKQWPSSYMNKPPYHCEAKAWMNCMELTKPFAMTNKHPIECHTDHSPLTWIKYTSGKGPVSQFIMENLSEMDYEMNYIKGTDNTTADALSRFPLLGPRKLRKEGKEAALHILLAALVKANMDLDRIWFHAGKDTAYLQQIILDWRDSNHMMCDASANPIAKKQYLVNSSPTVPAIKSRQYTMAILMPYSDKCTLSCAQLFRKDIPFAFLIPSDLVHYIAVRTDKGIDADVLAKVSKAHKISLLTPQLTWIVHNVRPVSGKTVLLTNMILATQQPNDDLSHLSAMQRLQKLVEQEGGILPGKAAPFKNKDEWTRLQAASISELDSEKVHVGADGLYRYTQLPNAKAKVIVPPEYRDQLAEWTHKVWIHAGGEKVHNVLDKEYYWPKMHKDCMRVCKSCTACNLLKAKRNLAHKYFRAKLHSMPRSNYAMDYYGVKSNSEGYNNILGIVDLASGYLTMRAVKNRTASNTAHVVLYDIVCKRGIPLVIHSDAAREFLSTAMSSLSIILGCSQTTTLAHNPKANAKIERIWAFVGTCLRLMNKQQYENFHLFVPIMEFVYNTTIDSDTKMTPFQIEHGMRARTPLDTYHSTACENAQSIVEEGAHAIATSIKAFRKYMSNVKQREKAATAARLNERGKSKIAYKVGDHVAIYRPPSQLAAQRAGRKAKHMLWWIGPATIIKSLSPNGTSFRIQYGDSIYERHVLNMKKWTGEVPATPIEDPEIHGLQVGSMVAVRDNPYEDDHYHIAQVTETNDSMTTLWYACTKGTALKTAVWTFLYRHKTNGVLKYQYLTSNNFNRDNRQFIAKLNTADLVSDPPYILQTGIRVTDCSSGFKIDTRSTHSLKRTASFPYRHHVLKKSWLLPLGED